MTYSTIVVASVRPLIAGLSLSLAMVGCATTEPETRTSTSNQTSAALSPTSIADAKAQIRRIAMANIDRTDNLAEVRAQLDVLVAPLAAAYGTKTVAEELPGLLGGWRQIWTDEIQPQPPILRQDPRQVYQVITDRGFYYNFANVKLFGFVDAIGALRGVYEDRGETLGIRFTKDGFKLAKIDARTNLVELTENLESGRDSLIGTPGGGQAPNGPIGISGSLRTIYLDQDIRIETGTQDDFRGPDGTVLVPGSTNGLFILDRAVTGAL